MLNCSIDYDRYGRKNTTAIGARMYDWCHSGLEGYCKNAAIMLADHVVEDREEETKKKGDSRKTQSDIQLQLCRELLPDRTEDSLARAWTLSNVRRGRGNRLLLFEKCWLGDDIRQKYFEEAKLCSRGVLPDGGFTTITVGSDYEARLRESANETECRDVVTSRIEADAIEACVKNILGLLMDDEAAEASSIVSLIQREDFPVEFFTNVIPAIERGLLSERYRSSDIRQFVLTLNGTIYKAHKNLSKYVAGEADVDLTPFCRFLITLFAGLTYGPRHPLAISRPWDATEVSNVLDNGHNMELREGSTIRVTQIFDESVFQTGYSELFRPAQVVFFGRSPVIDQYVRRCESIFPKDSDILSAVAAREKVVYPIAYHAAVSNLHAMLVCQGDVWWLYDLGSTNGISLASDAGIVDVDKLTKVAPGDRLRMGAPAESRGSNVYYDSATLLVTLNVDLAEDYV